MLQAINKEIREHPQYRQSREVLKAYRKLPKSLQDEMDAYIANFDEKDPQAVDNFKVRLGTSLQLREYYNPPDLFQVATFDLPYLYHTNLFKDSSKLDEDIAERSDVIECQEGHICHPDFTTHTRWFTVSPLRSYGNNSGTWVHYRYDTLRPLRLLIGGYSYHYNKEYIEMLNENYGLGLDGYLGIEDQHEIYLIHPDTCVNHHPIVIPIPVANDEKEKTIDLVVGFETGILYEAMTRQVPEPRNLNQIEITEEDETRPSPSVSYSREELQYLIGLTAEDLDEIITVLCMTKDLLESQGVILVRKIEKGLYELSDSRYLSFGYDLALNCAGEECEAQLIPLLENNPAIYRYGYLGVISMSPENVVDQIVKAIKTS